MLRKIVDLFTSLKLTIVCLAAGMALIFAGTLAQVHLGIHEAQQRYFQSMLVWWPPEGRSFKIPIFPGGHLIGAVLLVNLVAAHVKRFRWSWGKLGIHLTHAGLIIMLAGGLFTDLFAVESHMRLERGNTKNYSEDQRHMELAVIDTTDNDLDQVTAIPESVLRPNRTIDHWSLPFRIVVRNYYQNSRLKMLSDAGTGARPIANKGPGAMIAVEPISRTTGMDERDVPSAAIEILPKDSGGSLGTWLVSDALGAPQTFSGGGRTWMIGMRTARYYKPYSVTLQKFTHERYAGTEIPKNFASKVTLIDPERSVNRDVLIYMNHPLRYRGETFYQAGFQKDDSATILQVVHNPSFLAPYVACVIVAAGLLVQFGFHLVGFARKRRAVMP
ncbi:MAG TPA: cytochrome c biogenesis protein ResB [Chthoniobacterales bacterium]|nr:cytochrome c biogenesis protein ResB [Chthoniobacterales bacterium]